MKAEGRISMYQKKKAERGPKKGKTDRGSQGGQTKIKKKKSIST